MTGKHLSEGNSFSAQHIIKLENSLSQEVVVFKIINGFTEELKELQQKMFAKQFN